MDYVYDIKAFGDRLRSFRLGQMRRSARELSEELGDKNSVGMAELGKSLLSVRSLAYLAGRYDLNLHWLITGEGDRQVSPILGKSTRRGVNTRMVKPKANLDMMVEVPILSTFLSLGEPVPQAAEEIEDVALLYKSKVVHPGHAYALRARGDSMIPAIPDGALLFVDTHEDAIRPYQILDGRLVAVRLDDGTSIKWFEAAKNDWIIYAENKESGFKTLRIPRQVDPPVVGRVFAWYADI